MLSVEAQPSKAQWHKACHLVAEAFTAGTTAFYTSFKSSHCDACTAQSICQACLEDDKHQQDMEFDQLGAQSWFVRMAGKLQSMLQIKHERAAP